MLTGVVGGAGRAVGEGENPELRCEQPARRSRDSFAVGAIVKRQSVPHTGAGYLQCSSRSDVGLPP